MNTRHLSLPLLVLVLSTPLWSACADDPPSKGGDGAACTTSEECRAGFSCIDTVVNDGNGNAEKLSQCEPELPGAVGEPCTSNDDCAASLRCSEPQTVTVAGYLEDCSQEDVICGEALSCSSESGLCLAQPPPEGLSGWYQPCTSNSNCMPGLSCEDFEVPGESASRACLHQDIGTQDLSYCELIPGEGKLGEICYSDSDCISLVCLTSEWCSITHCEPCTTVGSSSLTQVSGAGV